MSELTPTRRGFLGMNGAALLGAVASSSLSGCGGANASASSIWDGTTNPVVSATIAGGAVVNGFCAPEFRAVFDAFVKNFEARNEIGASIGVTVRGVPVLEAWGGFADALNPTPAAPWARDTVSLVFSCTKGATALCAHMLVAQGLLDLDKPVAHYWPEFAAHGKDKITVRMVLGHAAGLAAVPFSTPVKNEGWSDPDYMEALLANMTPWWEPGTAYGYHAMTFGWLVGKIVKRVSGLSLGSYFATNVAKPLGMDFWIGMPDSALPRIAPMRAATETLANDPFLEKLVTDPGGLQSAVFFNVGGWFGLPPSTPPAYNSKLSLKSEIPAAGGVTNGRGLATMYAALANGGALGGTRLLPADYAAQVGAVRSALPIDRTLQASTRFGFGFHGSIDNQILGPGQSSITGMTAFGHGGFGGSIGFADPAARLSVGYTMNRMGPGAGMNERGQSIVDSIYKAMGYSTSKYGFWV
jgi:CubicO group peptidase (beta-lactamase class C family)